MKIKQITSPFFILLLALVAVAAVGVMAMSGLTSSTVSAYQCASADNPTNDPSRGDVWEYHESDGKCWKVRYTDRGVSKVNATANSDGVLVCPDGTAPISGSTTCAAQCTQGDIYHRDTNSCWYRNGYTEQDTGKMTPTNNDGTPLAPDNIACADGFTYIKAPADIGGSGCYQTVNGTPVCGPNERADKNISTGDTSGVVTVPDNISKVNPMYVCNPSSTTQTIPKNKDQSSDKTECREGLVKDGDECRLYSDFTNRGDCERKGGRFVMTDAKDPKNPRDDLYTCLPPEKEKNDDQKSREEQCRAKYPQPNQIQEREACIKGAAGDDCDKYTNEAARQACLAGQQFNAGVFDNCGEAETNIIQCDEQGIGAIGAILKFGITTLTVLVGIGAVGGIAWEAMQYARAQDDQSIVSNAKSRIRDIVIGLVVYVFMIAVINWLIPGGIIG